MENLPKYLVLDLNSFFASVEQQLNPKLRGKPVAVLPSLTPYTSVIAASYEAKKFGIKTNTLAKDAKLMCKDIIFVAANHKNYVEFHHKIIEEIDHHIPIQNVLSIDEVACELQGNERTLEGAEKLTQKIKKGILKNVGEAIKCSVGIAPNKFLAKIASDMQKPDGFTYIDFNNLEEKLLSLKLRDIPGIGRNMEQRLKFDGIFTMQDLLALEPKHMRKIWHSVQGEKIWYLLRGHDLPDTETKKSTIGHSHVLAPEFREKNRANIVAHRLTLKAVSRLRRIGYYATIMFLSIRTDKNQKLKTHREFFRASDNFTFLKILEEMWAELMLKTNRNDKIKKISVSLFGLVNDDKIYPDLFEEEKDMKQIKKQEFASKAMDKLNAKFGKDTIVIGFTPNVSSQFSGTKIAFNRIPEFEEFYE
ncbi:MAG: DNA-directed DNA polymerase [Rickettsiales bacterium]|nr:DNA-directed DNA polymerase [Rickettsiales bacterium]